MSVIDKIVIYGVPNPERLKLSEVLTNKINVTTLQLYSNPEQPTDDQFHKIDFQMWAYPDGIKIYDNYLQILNDSEPEFTFFQNSDILVSETTKGSKFPPEYVYSFVLTDYNLNRTYCTCLIWNERYFIKDDRDSKKADSDLVKSLTESMNKNQQKIFLQSKEEYSLAVPKCKIETMINNPLILDTNTILVYVPKAMILCSKTPCLQLQRNLLKYYYKSVVKQPVGKEKNIVKIPRIFENNLNQLIKNYGYPKAQSIFNEDKIQTVKKIQLKLLKNSMKYIEKDRSWGLLSVQTSKLKDFFISSLFTISSNPKTSSLMTESGQRIASRLKSDTVFHLPKIFDLFSQNFQLLQKSQLLPLPIPEFIQLWKCLLLQKQIIIFSNSQQQSMVLCQLMLHLIQPIKWQNIYIPFLPFHLSHHIDAIGGYLIGMSRIHMDYMLDKFDMKNKVVVDLQHQTILEQGGKQVIELPESIQSYIYQELKNIVDSYEQFHKPNRSLINYLITNPPQTTKQKTKYLQNYVKSWLNIQKIFFNTLVVLFNNFIPFISKKQDGIIAVETEEYLNILDDKLHRNFMKEISKTMVFIRLCEYHVEESERCAWVQKNLGELFVYSHDILSHKFVVSQADLNKNKQENSKSIRRAYAWTIQDLLLKHEKYSQYIQYLFEKNLKQIANTVITIELYLTQEQEKYKILTSDDQFESLDVQSIEIPLNFGKKLSKSSSGGIRQKDQEQYHNIYEQIQSEVIIKSKKYRKYGDKDEEQLYEQFAKLCGEHKIDRYLIKYIKYLQLNYPQNLKKSNSKISKKQNKKNGIFNWIWDILNPPDSTRGKQESEIKSKLERKMTMKNIKTDTVLNLKSLFRVNAKISQRKDSIEKNGAQKSLDQIRESEDSSNKADKDKEINERTDKFIKAMKQKGQRPSQTQSDMV